MRTLAIAALLGALAACHGADPGEPSFVAWGSSTSTITLAWQPVDGATGYELERVGGEVVLLDAGEVFYLDRELPEGTYDYRLTALGVDVPVQVAAASTSGDRAVTTVDDLAIGDPVVATVGSAGGAIELPDGRVRAIIPPGALPGETTVTLQEITPPTGGPDVAVEVSSEPAFSMPIELSFALDEDDRADLANVGVAAKQVDGTWVMQGARVEADRAITAVSPEVDALWAAPRGRSRAVKFRRVRIQPDQVNVKANTEHTLFARAIYSDDICQTEEVVLLCRGLDVPRGDALNPLPAPIVEARPLKNKDGTWTLAGPGTLMIEADEHAVTYIAPGSRPDPDYWTVSFTHTATRSSARARIRFIPDSFILTFQFDRTSEGIGYWLGATVHDEFSMTVDARPDGTMVVTPYGGPHNTTSTAANPFPLSPAIAATQTSPYELVTVDQSGYYLDHRNNRFTGTFPGTTQQASTTVTFEGGLVQSFPGGMPVPVVFGFIVEDIDFATITTEQWFTVRWTDWKMKVTPAPGP